MTPEEILHEIESIIGTASPADAVKLIRELLAEKAVYVKEGSSWVNADSLQEKSK